MYVGGSPVHDADLQRDVEARYVRLFIGCSPERIIWVMDDSVVYSATSDLFGVSVGLRLRTYLKKTASLGGTRQAEMDYLWALTGR